MSQPRKRTILTEDGELRDVADSQSEEELVYCNKCGTANAANATFCRKCGRSLVEQEAAMMGVSSRGGAKSKHDRLAAEDYDVDETPTYRRPPAPAASAVSEASAAVMQIFTLLSVAGMSITALVIDRGANAWILIPILVVWFLVEAVRGESRRHISPASAVSHIFMMLFVTGLVVTATVIGLGANAWVSIPILIVWFLVEAVRQG